MLAELDQSRSVAARVPIPGIGTTKGLLRVVKALFTTLVLLVPVAALVLVVSGSIAYAFYWPNLMLAFAFYLVFAHGVTVGLHRLFTHKSFEANRPLKITLAVLGSMAVEGSVIGWVADHRRHHRFVEKHGDPHTPARPETQRLGKLRGFVHAHMGWFYAGSVTSREKFAPDLLADRDLVIVDRLFLPLSVLSFAIPFGIGYLITGEFSGALAAFIWAGVLRVALFHHVSWCINSVCHVVGKRPFRTTDESTNVAPLAVLSMGEAWHNAHHAFPTLARHGVDGGQVDSSAWMIRIFERLGWATSVRWPEPALLATRRVTE